VHSGPGSCVIRSGLFGHRLVCCVVFVCMCVVLYYYVTGCYPVFFFLNGMKCCSPAFWKEKDSYAHTNT
jgi:hypothetical protein